MTSATRRVGQTGFHPLDGARYLRDAHFADPVLCSLVAHHSCAVIEAEERGLAGELCREFPVASMVLNDALAYCDMTTDPSGNVVSVHDRLAEIRERYGPGSIVTQFTRNARAVPRRERGTHEPSHAFFGYVMTGAALRSR